MYKETINHEGWERIMKYPEELRDEILKELLSENNPQVGKLAKEFGISRATMFNWRKEAGLLDGCSRKPEKQSSSEEGSSGSRRGQTYTFDIFTYFTQLTQLRRSQTYTAS